MRGGEAAAAHGVILVLGERGERGRGGVRGVRDGVRGVRGGVRGVRGGVRGVLILEMRLAEALLGVRDFLLGDPILLGLRLLLPTDGDLTFFGVLGVRLLLFDDLAILGVRFLTGLHFLISRLLNVLSRVNVVYISRMCHISRTCL